MTTTLLDNINGQNGSGTSHPTGTLAGGAPAEGTLIVLAISISASIATVTWPAGFTQKGAISAGGTNGVAIATKTAGPSETSSYTFTTSGACTDQSELMVFDSNATETLDTGSTNSSGAVSSIASGATATLAQADELAIVASRTSGTNGGSEAIDSGFTALDVASLDQLVVGYLNTSDTTALDVTCSWTTARSALIALTTLLVSTPGGGAAGPPTEPSIPSVPTIRHNRLARLRA